VHKSSNMRAFSSFFVVLLFCSISFGQKTEKIAFYNVENLFDTIDGPNDDKEFLPNAASVWDFKKYREKINHIQQVIVDLNYPIAIGFCEIENRDVLNDLRKKKKFKQYKISHIDSEDPRGIDVGLLYNASKLKLIDNGIIRFTLPAEEKPSTRDILWSKLALKKDTLFILVNHWPSRRSGTADSEPKRLFAAKNAKGFLDSILTINNSTKIIFMGDLNDYPEDKAPQLISQVLIPQISKQSGSLGGTHQYKGEWNILDHIMISEGMKNGKVKLIDKSGKIHEFPYLLEVYKGNKQPFRTYVGTKYLGGYSDHLPVSIDILVP